jgi:asparagine synthase (glutamine-hydrolysing)
MCGIGGLLNPDGLGPQHNDILGSMMHSLDHRGPDSNGVWMDEGAGIGFCHTRLAVIDLSERASQPMIAPDGRAALSYNGEIYNYRELRSELKSCGWRFVSDSDTEVVLYACLEWGVPRALDRFTGMFAFAFWHARERALYLVRDRMGIKPLYYGRAGNDLVFGSELKALCVHPDFSRSIDRRAMELYFLLQYIPSPQTIYSQAQKIPPGHYCRIDGNREELISWWDPDHQVPGVEGNGVESGDKRLETLLDDSVSSRLVSDVPLGSFLSGGMDSGLIVAAIARNGQTAPSTFTVSYQESEYDEGPVAAAVASYLGTCHHQVDVSIDTLLEGVLELPHVFDEPLSDPSALPMMVLSRLAREHVTVILSGDGGDELFGGYDRYAAVQKYMKSLPYVPLSMRRALATLMALFPSGLLASCYSAWKGGGRGRVENFAGKWEKLQKLLVQNGAASAYQAAIGIFSPLEIANLLGMPHPPPLPDSFHERLEDCSENSLLRRMMDLDTRTFLADDVLTKVDRASMSVGLEVRVPYLDHRIVQWSRNAADATLREGGKGKAPLRRLAFKDLPEHVVQRPKMGFTMPLDSWLRNQMRDLLDQYLGAGSRVSGTYFDSLYVDRLVREHVSGQTNHHEKLWNLLVFALWEEKWKPIAA